MSFPPRVRSGPGVQRAPELAQMVVVVAGEAGHPFAQLHAAPGQVNPAALPLPGIERVEQADHLVPAPLERLERLAPIAARVLTLLGPPVRIERMPDRAADAPAGQRLRGRAQREDRRLLHRE